MSDKLITEALSLFDQGIQIFLSDPVNKRGIGRNSEYDPIQDREQLVKLCEDNPMANLEIVVGKDEGVIALMVGVGNWSERGEESFNKLCGKYRVPETLAYEMPTGEKYYFFRFDGEPFDLEERSGMKWEKYRERFPVFPSIIDGNQVKKIGLTGKILSFSDWLAKKDNPNGISTSSVLTAEEETTKTAMSIGDAPSAIDRSVNVDVVEDGHMHNSVVSISPAEQLQLEISSWISSGCGKSTILSKALDWNRSNGESLKIEEIVDAVEKITDVSTKEVTPLTSRELLFKLAEGITLFHDDQNKPYFFYEGEAFAAPSEHVKNRLLHHYLMEMNDLPPKKELNAVLNIQESKARFSENRINLFNRVASFNDEIIYDLRDKRYVKVTPKGWEIVPSFPLFRRYNHMQPQMEPLTGGNPWQVFDLLTVPEENRLLVMVYIVSLFIPKIAHPVFAVCGDQGSAKSFFCTVINRLVDPTLTERVIQPKNERDFIQTVQQKYVTVLDNLSKIDNRVSDIFCQVCTGGSISYRKLYTDDGENIAQFRHVVILNSISLAIVNADLMDRSIILKLRRIAPEDRKPEHELWEAFEATRPFILGGIFDTVSKAMEIYSTVKVEHLPRLADFAKWGYAVAEALGMSGNKFLEDFTQNVKCQNESVVEKNVLCQAVLTLMAEGKPYLANVSDAHATLKSIAKQDAKDQTFPKLPHHLRTSLDKLRASLLEHGIEYKFLERKSTGVKILFTKSDASATPSSSEQFNHSMAAICGEADEPDEAIAGAPEIEFDEIPEVVHE